MALVLYLFTSVLKVFLVIKTLCRFETELRQFLNSKFTSIYLLNRGKYVYLFIKQRLERQFIY